MHHQYPVGQADELVEIAGDHQHRHVLRGDAFQQLIDIGAGGNVHAARGLIKDQQQRVSLQATRQQHLLLIAAGERTHRAIAIGHFDPQRPVIALHHRRFAPVLLPQRRLVKHHRVPAHRRIEKQPGNLPVLRQIDQPAGKPGARTVAADIAVFQPYPPGARRSQTVERFGKFGAPGSDQPGEADDLPGADLQVEIDKTFSGQIFYSKDREILRLRAAIARQRQPQLLRVAQRTIAADGRHCAD